MGRIIALMNLTSTQSPNSTIAFKYFLGRIEDRKIGEITLFLDLGRTQHN